MLSFNVAPYFYLKKNLFFLFNHTLKWLNVDDIYTVDNEQISAGPLKLTGSRPFQIAFGDTIPVTYMQHLENRRFLGSRSKYHTPYDQLTLLY